MRIVDRKTFLALPVGTIYAKYGNEEGDPSHSYFGEVRIKHDGRGPNDWWSVGFADNFDSAHDSGSWMAACDRMVEGADEPLNFETVSSDGLFDSRQLFAVFSGQDVARMIARLNEAYSDAYGK